MRPVPPPSSEPAGPGAPVPERLLHAATRLFAQRGFERASVQQIVQAAGVTKGAMYHYFGSKDDLLYEIYHRVLHMQQERLEAYASGQGTLPDRVRAAAVDVVATTIANLDDATIFFRSMHMLDAGKLATVRAERRRYHERFRDLINQGQRQGSFRADVSADLVVDFYFGSVHHLSTWYRPEGALDATQVGEQFAELLMSGLRPPAAEPT